MCLGIGMNGPRAPIKRTSALSVTSIILSKRNYSFLKGNMFWFKFIFGLKLFNRFDFYLTSSTSPV